MKKTKFEEHPLSLSPEQRKKILEMCKYFWKDSNPRWSLVSVNTLLFDGEGDFAIMFHWFEFVDRILSTYILEFLGEIYGKSSYEEIEEDFEEIEECVDFLSESISFIQEGMEDMEESPVDKLYEWFKIGMNYV